MHALRGPAVALRGPLSTLRGPVSALSGPVAALCGPLYVCPSGPPLVRARRGLRQQRLPPDTSSQFIEDSRSRLGLP
eukprot:2742402-Pyramimonas_sp.AAC.1